MEGFSSIIFQRNNAFLTHQVNNDKVIKYASQTVNVAKSKVFCLNNLNFDNSLVRFSDNFRYLKDIPILCSDFILQKCRSLKKLHLKRKLQNQLFDGSENG